MTQLDNPFESLAERVKSAGVPMAAVCKRANVANSTITRWKKGTFEPTFRTMRRMENALAELVADRTDTAAAEV